MNTGLFITLIIIGGVVWGEVLSCDSCGRECTAACGTRQFRTCCFNYLRKRTVPLSMDPSLRLELWLARSRVVHTAPQLTQTQLEIDETPQKDFNVVISHPSAANMNKEDINDYKIQSYM